MHRFQFPFHGLLKKLCIDFKWYISISVGFTHLGIHIVSVSTLSSSHSGRASLTQHIVAKTPVALTLAVLDQKYIRVFTMTLSRWYFRFLNKRVWLGL